MRSARANHDLPQTSPSRVARRCHFCETGGVLGLCLVRQTSIWFCGACREELEALVHETPCATAAGR